MPSSPHCLAIHLLYLLLWVCTSTFHMRFLFFSACCFNALCFFFPLLMLYSYWRKTKIYIYSKVEKRWRAIPAVNQRSENHSTVASEFCIAVFSSLLQVSPLWQSALFLFKLRLLFCIALKRICTSASSWKFSFTCFPTCSVSSPHAEVIFASFCFFAHFPLYNSSLFCTFSPIQYYEGLPVSLSPFICEERPSISTQCTGDCSLLFSFLRFFFFCSSVQWDAFTGLPCVDI